MMRFFPIVLFVALAILFSMQVFGEERASTSETPDALLALGLSSRNAVTLDEAKAVRGENVTDPDPVSCPTPTAPILTQSKTFTVGARSGYATGTVSLFEGLIATFEYNKLSTSYGADGSAETISLQVTGNIGGLTGSIGVNQDVASPDFGALTWFTAGKALNEVTNFSGDFSQNFAQYFEVPAPYFPIAP